MSESDDLIEIEKMSADQFAGAVVLILGAIGSLLLVVWQSKCHCRCNLCYIFQCERRPPSEEEMKSLKDQAKKLKELGVKRYNHNLETSRSKFPDICTTHTYQDRIETLNIARNAGTGLKYVEHFYYHHESSLSTEELSKGRKFFNKKKK